MEYKVEKREIIKMGVRSLYFKVEANSPENAEKKAEKLSSIDAYDSDFNIEETEYLETIILEN